LEESALVRLKLHLKLDVAHGADSLMIVECIDASVILPNETLQFSRTVGQFGRGLRKDLLRVGLVHVVGLGFASLVLLVSLDKTTVEGVVFLKLVIS
jgi:hypothetical protein